jgi:hypothetical protein
MPEQAHEHQNASQFPRIFYAKHMQPGICKYDKETVLVDTDTLKRMLPTGTAKPVYIDHQKVDLDTLKEKAAGYITESFYNELDGWAWFKLIAIDDDCHEAIAKGWSVSNAYRPTSFTHGGTKNNCPYDREITDGEFTHLAIVENPRYEGATIFTPEEFKNYQADLKRQLDELHNSNPTQEGRTMFKLFKNEKKEVTSVDKDTLVDLGDGKSISVEEMLNAVKKNDDDEAAKAKAEKEKENAGDPMVKCNEGEMPLSELVNKYNAMAEKKNAEDEKEKKNAEDKEKKEAEEKKNAEDAEKKKEEEKKNSKHFEELRNANLTAGKPVQIIETSMDQLARGKLRYGKQAK